MEKVMWKHVKQFGFECCLLTSGDAELTAQGTIIYETTSPAQAHVVNYFIKFDEKWITRNVEICVDDYYKLILSTDGEGNWFNVAGNSIQKLKGAIDIDISNSPFSNSLPINRLSWKLSDHNFIDVVYISLPTLEIKKIPQSYKFLYQDGCLRYFHYQCGKRFEQTLSVDTNGLVFRYPKLFERLL
ncbi:putative glycolipid-binding domain-containing protein [Alkalihalophilus pseudofirmus]|uniref:putative glycolipid-binding domain-containing protein n=1 Tax=Alkalihalophilus pseudofirmus TaxID=79885 RepID=UPI00259B1B01|nr:putative glycolipid-binding domain-containing protein [Alkalihalophilus pseudofirmus]WEG18758.1 putative glycolipid-binding domain-containing protein [Alkalihalophilus pseudofirmus]